ncbi:MAG: hypothetical protein HIU92_13315 [Proteobacteria bacterium]|nr:hypothetical protein [Pseudomonadota bacterium]
MAENRKHGTTETERRAADSNPAKRPAAKSVDREPSDEPTPESHEMSVDREDEPKGHPTSDRFHTEQAHADGSEDEASDTQQKK